MSKGRRMARGVENSVAGIGPMPTGLDAYLANVGEAISQQPFNPSNPGYIRTAGGAALNAARICTAIEGSNPIVTAGLVTLGQNFYEAYQRVDETMREPNVELIIANLLMGGSV